MPSVREVLDALKSLDVADLRSQLSKLNAQIRELHTEREQIQQLLLILDPPGMRADIRDGKLDIRLPALRPGEYLAVNEQPTPLPGMVISKAAPADEEWHSLPEEESSPPFSEPPTSVGPYRSPPVGPGPRRSPSVAEGRVRELPPLPAHLAPSAAERAVQSGRNRDSRTEVEPELPPPEPPKEEEYDRNGCVEKVPTKDAIVTYLTAAGPSKVKLMAEQLGRSYATIYAYCSTHPELFVKTGEAEYGLKQRH
jgi:hypothetical protein